MTAYRRVYDSHHLRADCQNRDQLRNSTLGNRVWDTFTFTDSMRAALANLLFEIIKVGDGVLSLPRFSRDLVDDFLSSVCV